VQKFLHDQDVITIADTPAEYAKWLADDAAKWATLQTKLAGH
jgi:hypothetical protein